QRVETGFGSAERELGTREVVEVDRSAVDVSRRPRELDRLAVVAHRGRVVAPHVRDRAEVAERRRDSARLALAAEERDRLLVEGRRAFEIELADRHAAELGGCPGEPLLVAELPVEIQALLQEGCGELVVPLAEGKDRA